MNIDFTEVTQNIHRYFKDSLPQYKIIEIRRQSYHPEDDYLYMVTAQAPNGTYTVWTSWNESIQTLNCGHYGLSSMEACSIIMAEYQSSCGTFDIKYSTPQEKLKKLLIKNEPNFHDSFHELLYIMGYADGIRAQQENNWHCLTDTDADMLFAESLKN